MLTHSSANLQNSTFLFPSPDSPPPNGIANFSTSGYFDPPPPPNGGLGIGASPFFGQRTYYLVPSSLVKWRLLEQLGNITDLVKSWFSSKEKNTIKFSALESKNVAPITTKDLLAFNPDSIQPTDMKMYSLRSFLQNPYTRVAASCLGLAGGLMAGFAASAGRAAQLGLAIAGVLGSSATAAAAQEPVLIPLPELRRNSTLGTGNLFELDDDDPGFAPPHSGAIDGFADLEETYL